MKCWYYIPQAKKRQFSQKTMIGKHMCHKTVSRSTWSPWKMYGKCWWMKSTPENTAFSFFKVYESPVNEPYTQQEKQAVLRKLGTWILFSIIRTCHLFNHCLWSPCAWSQGEHDPGEIVRLLPNRAAMLDLSGVVPDSFLLVQLPPLLHFKIIPSLRAHSQGKAKEWKNWNQMYQHFALCTECGFFFIIIHWRALNSRKQAFFPPPEYQVSTLNALFHWLH